MKSWVNVIINNCQLFAVAEAVGSWKETFGRADKSLSESEALVWPEESLDPHGVWDKSGKGFLLILVLFLSVPPRCYCSVCFWNSSKQRETRDNKSPLAQGTRVSSVVRSGLTQHCDHNTICCCSFPLSLFQNCSHKQPEFSFFFFFLLILI